jgi:hypothetical protein
MAGSTSQASTSTTALFPDYPQPAEPTTCFICEDANLRIIGPLSTCRLCDRDFCETHSSKVDGVTVIGVCEIDHEKYYDDHPQDHSYIFRSLEDWQKHEEKLDDGAMFKWYGLTLIMLFPG